MLPASWAAINNDKHRTIRLYIPDSARTCRHTNHWLSYSFTYLLNDALSHSMFCCCRTTSNKRTVSLLLSSKYSIRQVMRRLHCESKTGHLMFCHSFGKCEQVLEFFHQQIRSKICTVPQYLYVGCYTTLWYLMLPFSNLDKFHVKNSTDTSQMTNNKKWDTGITG